MSKTTHLALKGARDQAEMPGSTKTKKVPENENSSDLYDGLQVKRLVSKRDLKTQLGIPYSGQHIARLEVAGRFPKRIRLGQNRVAWLLTDVEAWIDERIAASREENNDDGSAEEKNYEDCSKG